MNNDPLTIATALQRARLSIPTLDAQTLLCAALNVERAHLLMHPDAPITPEQAARFESWLARASAGEPIAYILGRRAFYDRQFIVTPDVLIPRPETEHLLELALDFTRERAITAVDVGTGSGALAVTLAALRPNITVHAVDISTAALTVARVNAERHNTRVIFHHGDLLEPLIAHGVRPELVMANLPYIAADELPTLAVSQYEPHLALDGGADGLDLVRRLLDQAADVCAAGALLLLEIGAQQGERAAAYARERLDPLEVTVMPDYAGHDRIVCIVL